MIVKLHTSYAGYIHYHQILEENLPLMSFDLYFNDVVSMRMISLLLNSGLDASVLSVVLVEMSGQLCDWLKICVGILH